MRKTKYIPITIIVLIAGASIGSFAGNEINYRQTNSQIEKAFIQNEKEIFEKLNYQFNSDNTKLDVKELKRALEDSSLSDNVKCYYLDAYREISNKGNERAKFEKAIWMYIESDKISNVVRNYLVSCLSLSECVDINKLEEMSQSQDKELKLMVLRTIATFNSKDSERILKHHLESTEDKEMFLYISRFYSLLDETNNMDSVVFEKFLENSTLSESDLMSFLFTIGQYKDPKLLKLLNKEVDKLEKVKKEHVLFNAMKLINKAYDSSEFKADAIESIKKAPFKQYNDHIKIQDVEKLNIDLNLDLLKGDKK